MFERISNGFSMARSSWRVVMADKKLLLFPVVSGILFMLVVASFVIPLALLQDKLKLVDANNNPQPLFYVLAFAFYFCTYFVVIFCNAALVSCALLRFNGQTPTLGDGFRAAMSRLPQILAWALVAATVGLLLKLIENAHEKAGYWIAAVIGTAWSIMTYFVVPVLVVEKVGPFAAVSRSMALMKKTWGEALAGKIGLGLFLFLLGLVIFVPLIILIVLLQNASPAVFITMLVIAGLAYLMYMALAAALNTVFLTAVYQYASQDTVPDGFDRQTMADAFAAKA